MAQPQYDRAYLLNMSPGKIAEELRNWAKARRGCNHQRARDGKEPLDIALLLVAAEQLDRLEGLMT